jgi:hypothetical protein
MCVNTFDRHARDKCGDLTYIVVIEDNVNKTLILNLVRTTRCWYNLHQCEDFYRYNIKKDKLISTGKYNLFHRKNQYQEMFLSSVQVML